jgi:NADP-dependent 3-hydroxy acid dehydrogenase YdfG
LAGRVDVLVNNAGIIIPGPMELLPVSAFGAQIETNVNGSLRLFRALAPQMREREQGYLIQMSSCARAHSHARQRRVLRLQSRRRGGC